MNAPDFRHAPAEVEIEQAVLGAILVDNRRLETLTAILKADDFSDPLHQRTFETMLKVWEQGRAITPLTLSAIMRADPGLSSLNLDYFGVLADAAPSITNVKEMARVIREAAVRRELLRIGEDLANASYETDVDRPPAKLIEEAEKALYRVSETAKYGRGPMDFAEALRRTVALAEKAQARGGRISGVPTGFSDIDGLLGGLQPSDLIILAGRPGMGKSSLATNMAFHMARTYAQDVEAGADVPRGAPVLFFSLEMAAQQLGARILSEQTELEMWKIRNGKFSESEWEQFVICMQSISAAPLYFDDTGGISIAQIAARARRMKREKNIGCIMIDHIQLVAGSGRPENRVQEITEISKGLKVLAKELDVPVVALSQLSRSVDSRDDKRPVLSDLRESGSIEQDADVVMFIYREEYYLKSREPDPASPDHAKWLEKCERAHRRAEILVEKHRHGATNKLDLFFDDRFTRFSNAAEET
ncbi:MAG TPA: replicative DNA helicase [Rhizomicrobium sp.]|jgi:replicative DNA helicase|nr:replicative DNA helicase [Rhizomicrobium sp.]